MNGNNRYPRLVVDHKKLKRNAEIIVSKCAEQGIAVAGVIKGATGMVSFAKDYEEAGAAIIGTSRLEQLARCKAEGIKVPLLLIRIPMMSEVGDMVSVCDYSLQSELSVIERTNEEALRQGKVHKVILMADLGDLREGFFDHDELVDAAVKIEKEMAGIELAGIGTNLGCYGSVIPTEDKMVELAELAERVEAAIGRKLEYVSGGATSSLLGVYRGYMPDKINMLRIGAAVIAGPLEDVRTTYGLEEIDELSDDAFTLEAEVVEVKIKATHPIGTLGVDAFGKKREYEDRGMRKRALIAAGRADYGDTSDLIPQDEGVSILGASGDHTILDVEDFHGDLKPGDILTFKIKYSAILYLSGSENVITLERR
jgi:predicted amino acid racemase